MGGQELVTFIVRGSNTCFVHVFMFVVCACVVARPDNAPSGGGGDGADAQRASRGVAQRLPEHRTDVRPTQRRYVTGSTTGSLWSRIGSNRLLGSQLRFHGQHSFNRSETGRTG